MAVRSIGSVINTGFVARVSSSAPNSTTADAIRSFPSSVSDVKAGLRVGARRIANTVTQVNGAISALNVSKETLQELEKIVDKVIDIASRAEKGGVGSQARQQFTREFNKLGQKFTKIVENESREDIDLLTGEGVETALSAIGLAPESVSEIGELFKKLSIVSKQDTLLANEEKKGPRPVRGREVADLASSGGVDTVEYTDPNFDLLSNQQTATVGANVARVASADFDNDGDLDLVGASSVSSDSYITLNNSSGTFAAALSHVIGGSTYDVVTGDFDDDGNQDYLASHQGTGYVGLYRGNGDGTFMSVVTAGLQTDASELSVSDFDGDGSLDFSTLDSGTGSTEIFLNNGDGTFASASSIAVGGGGLVVDTAVGDFNNDGKEDLALAVGNLDYNVLYYGNGDGTFSLGASLASSVIAANATSSIAAGDLNGDGIDDLASAGSADGKVNVYLNNGNGTFKTRASYTIGGGGNPVTLGIGDIDGDGTTDLAYSAYAPGTPHIGILKGNGHGAFRAAVTLSTTGAPQISSIGDYNGDGRNDLVFKDPASTTIGILESNRVGTTVTNPVYTYTAPNLSLLSRETNLVTANEISNYVATDFDNDGDVDLFGTDSGTNVAYYIRSNGDGSFALAQSRAAFSGDTAIANGDFNLDGIQDLFFSNKSGGYTSVALGNGDGTFQSQVTSIALTDAANLATGDFDGDGKTDVVVTGYATNVSRIYRGHGDGTFADAGTITTGVGDELIDTAVGDFNDDGHDDIAFAYQNRDFISVYNGNGDGTFAGGASLAASITNTGTVVRSVKVGDANNDGVDDLVAASENDGVVSVFIGNGDGTFEARVSYSAVGGNVLSATLADIDGDGSTDLTYTTAAAGGSPHLGVRLGNGDGTFGSASTIASTGVAYTPLAADVTGDGRNDIVFQDFGGVYTRILKSDRVAIPEGEYNRSVHDSATLFSSGRTLQSRNDATLVLTDAKALKEQIKNNISIIDKTTKEITQAIDLLRATGFGFLETSKSLTSVLSVDSVTSTLQKAIRDRGGKATDAAGFLDPLISATLLRESSSR